MSEAVSFIKKIHIMDAINLVFILFLCFMKSYELFESYIIIVFLLIVFEVFVYLLSLSIFKLIHFILNKIDYLKLNKEIDNFYYNDLLTNRSKRFYRIYDKIYYIIYYTGTALNLLFILCMFIYVWFF